MDLQIKNILSSRCSSPQFFTPVSPICISFTPTLQIKIAAQGVKVAIAGPLRRERPQNEHIATTSVDSTTWQKGRVISLQTPQAAFEMKDNSQESKKKKFLATYLAQKKSATVSKKIAAKVLFRKFENPSEKITIKSITDEYGVNASGVADHMRRLMSQLSWLPLKLFYKILTKIINAPLPRDPNIMNDLAHECVQWRIKKKAEFRSKLKTSVNAFCKERDIVGKDIRTLKYKVNYIETRRDMLRKKRESRKQLKVNI